MNNMTDNELRSLYSDYEAWCETGAIPSGTKLATLRDQYREKYGSTAIIILERDFLRECAKRFCT